jgi:DNA-binding XRE family transcriptional regulator
MMPKRDWLWDRNITGRKVKAVLTNPNDRQFLSLASLLLARKNTPKEVFRGYLKPVDFLKNWHSIKRQMRKDSWNNPRIEFWQAIYEKLKEKYKKNGAFSVKQIAAARPEDEFCKLIADKIKVVRKQKGLTQSALAKRLKVSQQMVSRIEKGGENISLLTLKNIVDSLGGQVSLEIF